MEAFEALQGDDPRQVGPFRVVARLGAGGMGRVYLGRSKAGRAVAVKVVRPELAGDGEFRRRFAREVAVARTVNGFFTAGVVAADPDGSPPWLATAYVPGVSLDRAVAEHGPWPEASVLALGAGLAEALEAIHAAGVVHRDLKPSNVLLASDGPRVIDFGISVALEASRLTRTDVAVGTPGFMSPEQLTGEAVGPASDVFSLGAVLAFTATGAGPFGTGSLPAMVYRVVHQEPDLSMLPPRLRPVVARCLAKRPGQRPSASELLDELAGSVTAKSTIVEFFADSAWMPGEVARLVHAKVAAPPTPSGTAGGSSLPHPGPDTPRQDTPRQDTAGEDMPREVTAGEDTAGDPGMQEPGEQAGSRRPIVPSTPASSADGAPEHGTVLLTEVYGSDDPAVRSGGRDAARTAVADGRTGSRPTRMPRRRVLRGLAAIGVTAAVGWPLYEVLSRIPGLPKRQWAFATGGWVRSSPAMVGGVVYVGSDDGKVYAITAASGLQRWSFRTGAEVVSSPAVAKGVVYVGSDDGKVYAIDAATGRKRWSFATDGWVRSSPAVTKGTVYVSSGDFNVYALDAATGRKRWSFRTGAEVGSSPAVADGVVYVGGGDTKVYALDAATGRKRWSFRTGAEVDSSPAVADGVVYIGGRDTKVYALDAATGRERWSLATFSWVRSSPTVVGGVVYVGINNGTVYAIEAATGRKRWSFSKGATVQSSPVVVDGVVYIGFDDTVYALDAATGRERRSFAIRGSIVSTPAVADGMVYFGGSESVYAFLVR